MKNPYILHMFNATKNASPFDINMAYEADFDSVVPYSEVTLNDIYTLTQDAIFSRGPSGVKRTSIFIGGRELGLSIDMLNRAKSAMVPPFEVSVFTDPSGAITTAAALIACIMSLMAKAGHGELTGRRIDIIGGTGPVGVCAGILAAYSGAKVYLASRRSTIVAQEYAKEYNQRFGVNMKGSDCSTEAKINDFISQSDIIISAAKAGIQVLSKAHLEKAQQLLIAADVNAVPPLGIEGVESKDMGKVLAFSSNQSLGLGALAIGDVKYKIHYRALDIMRNSEKPVYFDPLYIFKLAKEELGIT